MLNKILNLLTTKSDSIYDKLIYGAYADEYGDKDIQDNIRQTYLDRWHPDRQLRTPSTHPELFDPIDPPVGWRYDPIYECWIRYKSGEKT